MTQVAECATGIALLSWDEIYRMKEIAAVVTRAIIGGALIVFLPYAIVFWAQVRRLKHLQDQQRGRAEHND